MNTDAYENMTWETPSDELEDAVENLLAEVKRLRSDLEINYQARRELEFETLEQQVLIYKLMGEEE